jgi:hypothetical protein
VNPTDIREAVAEHIDAEVPPAPDLGRVVARGRRLRRRRRATAGTALLAAGVVLAAVVALTEGDVPGHDTAYDPVGRLDISGGMRAFASPDGGEVHLGGRTFTDRDLPFLDTDAIATDAGLVFYRDGAVHLLDESGVITQLDRSPGETSDGLHPTAKADSTNPWVAYGLPSEGGVKVTVFDLSAREQVASHQFACDDCSKVVIDALDAGTVFVRTAEETQLWDVASDSVETFATGETRVADVRNGVVLYDGPAPEPSAVTRPWRMVKGAIDAQLTFDGGHVLDWSSRLEPTTPGGEPIVLAQPKPGAHLAFWNVDTDGSIMVAIPRRNTSSGMFDRADVYDCAVPAGSCAPIGEVATESGDPMFIGNDM